MKLLLPFFLFCFSFSFGQVSSNEPELTRELLEEFILQGLKNDFHAKYHIDTHLAGVYFITTAEFQAKFPDLESDDACVAFVPNYTAPGYDRVMFINTKHLEAHRRNNLKAITAHELSHFFGMPHEKNRVPDVMNPILSSAFELSDDDYTRLFNQIKRIPPANYMLTIKF